MKLLKRDKNTLFKQIIDRGLNPNDFEFDEPVDPFEYGATSRVTYISDEEYYFDFTDYSGGAGWVEFCPGYLKYTSEYSFNEISFDKLNDSFGMWLDSLIQEVEQEDLWEKLSQQKSISPEEIFENNSQDKFDDEEKVLMRQRIEKLRIELSAIPAVNGSENLINEKMDILIEKLNTEPKSYWGTYFLGTITSIIIQLSLSQDQGRLLWAVVKKVFSSLVLN